MIQNIKRKKKDIKGKYQICFFSFQTGEATFLCLIDSRVLVLDISNKRRSKQTGSDICSWVYTLFKVPQLSSCSRQTDIISTHFPAVPSRSLIQQASAERDVCVPVCKFNMKETIAGKLMWIVAITTMMKYCATDRPTVRDGKPLLQPHGGGHTMSRHVQALFLRQKSVPD